MATNENLPQTLVKNLIDNGYTPRTPEEWIYSALDYLSQNTVSPPLGGGSGLNPDGSTVGATAQAQNFGTFGIKADVIDEATALAGVTINPSGGLKTNNIVDANPAGNLTIIHSAFSNTVQLGKTGGVNITSKNAQGVIIDDGATGGGVNFASTSGDILFPGGSKFDSAAAFSFIAANGIKTNLIKDNGAHITIDQTSATKRITIQTVDSNIEVNSGENIAMSTANNGDINIDVQGSGVINMNGAPTYTGTVAGAGALSIVNGLVMA